MTDLNVVFWNIENFGIANDRYDKYFQRSQFIAAALKNCDADILFLQELNAGHLNSKALKQLFQFLNRRSAEPQWLCNWIPGSLSTKATPPYNTPTDVCFCAGGHNEGYAVLWRVNIAKYAMQKADPIDQQLMGTGTGFVPNHQSAPTMIKPGIGAVTNLTSDIIVNATDNFLIYAGTTPGAGGIMSTAGLLPAGVPITATQRIAPGTLIPAGTTISPEGMQIRIAWGSKSATLKVIPGHFNLTTALTLPNVGDLLIPQYALGLVLSGITPPFTATTPYATTRRLLNFPDGSGMIVTPPVLPTLPSLQRFARRPAFCTVKLNRGPAVVAPNRTLVPIIAYHTPAKNVAARSGMLCASDSVPLYYAFDQVGGGYVQCANAIIGGDFNVKLDANDPGYNAFTLPWVSNGAGCTMSVAYPNYPPAAPPTNPLNKSLVDLKTGRYTTPPKPSNTIILSNTSSDYRGVAIDNAFYRLDSTAGSAITNPGHPFNNLYFLVDAVGGVIPPGLPAGTLFNILSNYIKSYRRLNMFPPRGAVIALPDVLNLTTMLQDFQAGGFGSRATLPTGTPPPTIAATGVVDPPYAGPATYPAPAPVVVTSQRRAAEFIRLFISDHLPVLFVMQY